jgi:hypothetical protein
MTLDLSEHECVKFVRGNVFERDIKFIALKGLRINELDIPLNNYAFKYFCMR